MIDCEIVILNWNTWHHVRRAVEGLAPLSSSTDVRITVVDNGSTATDPSFERDFPWVCLRRLPSNLGYAAGNNVVLSATDAEFVVLQNSDAFPTVPQLEHLLNVIRSDPRVGAVGPALVDENGIRQIGSYGYHPTSFRWLVEVLGLSVLPGFREVGVWGRRVVTDEASRDVPWVSGACMVLRMAAVREVGLLPDINFMYMEDIDWCSRARTAGWRIVYLPNEQVIHLFGGSQPSDSATWVESIAVHVELHYGPITRAIIMASGVVGCAWRAGASFVLAQYPSRRSALHRIRARRFLNYARGFADAGRRRLMKPQT